MADIIRADGWNNVLTGMGTSQDRKESTSFAAEFRLGEIICRNLYTYSGLAKAIIDLVVYDGLRKGFTIEGDTDNTLQVETKRLQLKRRLSQAWRRARNYGGALMVMMVNDGRTLDQPLNEAGIQEIESLKVFHRWRVSRISYYMDPKDPRYSQTELYLVTPQTQFGTSFTVHESRCLVFDGVDVDDDIRAANQWWGDSVHQAIYGRLKGLGEMHLNIDHIIGEFVLMITKIKGLAQKLAENKESEIIARAAVNNMTRHVMGSYMLDADGEEAERVSASVAGLRDIAEVQMMSLSAETRYPIRKLFGSPITGAGLSNNGNQEGDDYDAFVEAERADNIDMPLERLVRLIMLQKRGPFGGRELPNWKINWTPLKVESQKDVLANRKTQSEIDKTYYELGAPVEPILTSRFGGESYSFETILKSGDIEDADVVEEDDTLGKDPAEKDSDGK